MVDLVDRVTRKNQDLVSELPLTISAQYGLIDQNEFFDKRVASKDVSGYYLIENGEFAYNKSTSTDDVCGLGTVIGLCGANCYHTYFPFVPGVSVRTYTDDWLDEQNWKESEPTEFRGKEYTLYEAKQRQRQMETAMRAQREKVQMLQDGDADPNDVMLAKCKYQGQLDEYARFSKQMGLKQERERIYIDGRWRVAPGRIDKKLNVVNFQMEYQRMCCGSQLKKNVIME